MVMKKTCVSAGIDLLIWLVACLVSIPIMAIALRIVNLFVVVDVSVALTVRLIASCIAVCGVLGSVSYLVAYHTASFPVSQMLPSLGLATVLRFALSLLLKFYPFIAGGTQYLAALLFDRNPADMKAITDMRLIDYVVAFFLVTALDWLFVILLGKFGERNRLRDRKALMEEAFDK